MPRDTASSMQAEDPQDPVVNPFPVPADRADKAVPGFGATVEEAIENLMERVTRLRSIYRGRDCDVKTGHILTVKEDGRVKCLMHVVVCNRHPLAPVAPEPMDPAAPLPTDEEAMGALKPAPTRPGNALTGAEIADAINELRQAAAEQSRLMNDIVGTLRQHATIMTQVTARLDDLEDQ